MTQSAFQAVFLALPVQSIGTSWMIYALIFSPAVCAVVLLFVKVEYTRLKLDLANTADYAILDNKHGNSI